jgi:hypothetical protein
MAFSHLVVVAATEVFTAVFLGSLSTAVPAGV